VGRVCFVYGIVQDVSGEFAFVLLEVGEDLLSEFFSGGGHRSFAWGQDHAGEGVLIADGEIGGNDGTLGRGAATSRDPCRLPDPCPGRWR
jgi:hypothetical protein